eukprot:gene29815-36924_t
MGAGFIGCIIMESLKQRGVELSVVEMGDRMVPRMMGPMAGGMIRDWCEAQGVKVYVGTRVESIESAGQGLQVRLSNGQTVEADLVISATGVRPAIGFLKDSGITCLQGILTDQCLQTNVPGIYAAGDCAEAFDKVSGQTIVSAIQPNAVLVQWPREGVWTIAFITGAPNGEVAAYLRDEFVSVYVPTTPNPTGGYFVMLRKSDCVELDMSVDAALKYIVSMGVVAPADPNQLPLK